MYPASWRIRSLSFVTDNLTLNMKETPTNMLAGTFSGLTFLQVVPPWTKAKVGVMSEQKK